MYTNFTKSHRLLSLFLLLFPTFLSAHGSHGSGIMAGFTHPIFGFDHLAALIGLGVLSASYSKSKQWWPIAGFLAAMVVGGLLGIGMEAYSTAELIILASVFVFGGMLAVNYKLGLVAFLVMSTFFGFFHGLAHGIEMPENTSTIEYISGFILGAGLIATTTLYIGKYMFSRYLNWKIAMGFILILTTLFLIILK